jgi:predicted alpha/beta-fold hydrolase
MPPIRRLYDFDDWYTAPVSGFPNADTYYARCSAAQFMPQIAVPTWVVTSHDDPLVPIEMFQEAHTQWPSAVRLTVVPGGGHVGYIARPGSDADRHWLEWRLVELVAGSTGLQQ